MTLRRRQRGRGPHRPRPGAPKPAAVATGAAVAGGVAVAAPTPRRKTVLVVEDNAAIGGLIVALLREDGYRALRAWDPREAVRMARDRKPDLIVMELSLPYREGVPALAELKAQDETKDAPILIVSGNVLQISDEERELVVDCLIKPIDMDRLVNAARSAMGDPEHDVPPKDYGSVDFNLHSY
jgi:DNA-binding response OmpR family regulator